MRQTFPSVFMLRCIYRKLQQSLFRNLPHTTTAPPGACVMLSPCTGPCVFVCVCVCVRPCRTFVWLVEPLMECMERACRCREYRWVCVVVCGCVCVCRCATCVWLVEPLME